MRLEHKPQIRAIQVRQKGVSHISLDIVGGLLQDSREAMCTDREKV